MQFAFSYDLAFDLSIPQSQPQPEIRKDILLSAIYQVFLRAGKKC